MNNLKEKNLFPVGKEWLNMDFIHCGAHFRFSCKLFAILFSISNNVVSEFDDSRKQNAGASKGIQYYCRVLARALHGGCPHSQEVL